MLTLFATIAGLLIAGVENWFKIIFFLVVFVIWIVNNVLNEKNSKAKRAAKRANVEPVGDSANRPQPIPAAEGFAGAGQSKSPQLNSEIEEFLQRANRKRSEKSQRKSARAAAKPAPPVVAAAAAPARRRLVESLKSADQSSLPSRTGRAAGAFVAPDLSTYDDGPSRLLDNDFLKDDAERQARFQQNFQHQVGRLTDTSLGNVPGQTTGPQSAGTSAQAPAPTVAAVAGVPLATLLSNPQSLQHAIVMQEILHRPEERWQ
jgi:hypothetical protein